MNQKKVLIVVLYKPDARHVKDIHKKSDFSGAAIFLTEKKNILLQKAVQILQDEIQKRSGILLPVIYKPSSGYPGLITVAIEEHMDELPVNISAGLTSLPETGKEGFKITNEG